MLFSHMADLPLEIDSYAFERLTGGERITTMLRLVGGGTDGVGEEIGGMDAAYHDTLAEQTSWPLAGSWTLESFLDALASFDQWGGEEPEWGDFARPFRNWMFESAALDLALRQAGRSLPEALGRTPHNVTFVNSFPLGEGASLDVLLRRAAMYPTVGYKVDAAPSWTADTVRALAATGLVRTVDFKGRYGSEVEGDLAPVYEAVVELLPDALIEDAHVEFVDALPHERLSFDAPIKRVADIGDTRTINIKPTRIGGLRPLLEIYEHCAEHGVAMYGGGMGELGPARMQIQLLASLFHPDGPNDVAPPAFNLPEPVEGLPASPLVVSKPPFGFRLR
jgi:hypothetical protein